MINRISFENFRGLKKLDLPELSQITLFTGKNNAGKSSILEGVYLFICHALPNSFVLINNFRGIYVNMDPPSIWGPAFYGLDTEKTIKISAVLNNKQCDLSYQKDSSFVAAEKPDINQTILKQFASPIRSNYSMKYRYQQKDYSEEGFFYTNGSGVLRDVKTSLTGNQLLLMPNIFYINSATLFSFAENTISDWIGQLELTGKKEGIVDALKYIEKDISNLITITNQGQVQVFAKVSDQVLPVKLAGDGLFRLMNILLAIAANPGSIILIDEIETGFHYSMYETLWTLIAKTAKDNNCQIIATTHSYECIQNAVSGISAVGCEDSFCMYRIEHSDGENRAYRYDGELTRLSIDMNMEVR